MRVTTLEGHVAGAAVRLVTSGMPSIEGATMVERQQSFESRASTIASRLTREPCGHAGMVGVVLTEAERPDAAAGMLFFTGNGSRPHSGHAALGALALARAHGVLTSSRAVTAIDTPGGPCVVEVVGATGSGTRVCYRGPGAAVLGGNQRVTVRGRTVRLDLAWSGSEVVAIVEGESAGVPLSAAHTLELRRTGLEILDVLEGMVKPVPPGQTEAVSPTGCVFVGAAAGADADVRAVMVRADGTVSRSPSASGTAAVAVVLSAMGLVAPGTPSRHESLSGTSWTAAVMPEGELSTVAISADVFATGTCEWHLAPGDPLTRGVVWA
jgi:proline racemase